MELSKENKSWLTFLTLEIFFIVISFFTGYWIRDFSLHSKYTFPILFESLNILEEKGLKEIPDIKVMEYGMIKGMLQVYNDPHTFFVEPPQAELQSNQLQGKFGGIGARLQRDPDNNLVLYPFKDSPAMKAGILEGDQLIAIDSFQVKPDTAMDIVQAEIRGPIDTMVTLTIIRPPETKQIKITIKRQEISLPSVTSNLVFDEPKVGIIQINIVADTTPAEVESNLKTLIERGATHFILDLRNDYGGLVDAGVNTARLFLEDGTIIKEQYKDKPERAYSVDKKGPFSDIPLVILVNQNTASAAEIIAGSLQARKRAILVGSPTYGKDTIQLVYELQDKSSIHVTAAHWWIPESREKSSENRLHPDIVLSNDSAADNNLIIKTAVKELLEK